MSRRNTPTFKSFEEKVESLKVRKRAWPFSWSTVCNCIIMADVTTDQGEPRWIIHRAWGRVWPRAECRACGQAARRDERSGSRATLRNSFFPSLHSAPSSPLPLRLFPFNIILSWKTKLMLCAHFLLFKLVRQEIYHDSMVERWV